MPASPTVLHYVGYDDDRGGIVSVVRALAGENKFGCVLGMNVGGVQRRVPALPVRELPRLDGEKIGPVNLWRARRVAAEVRRWLREDPSRVFHGHSRAGLLVALWLNRWRERRVVVSVHCYGKQRWFYRLAAARLGAGMFWLSPAMRGYYGVGGEGWEQCVPGCVPVLAGSAEPREAGGAVVLAGVGALVEWKGWHLVVEAMARLPAEVRRRLRFRHIGGVGASEESRAYAAALAARTQAAGLTDCIQWLGEQPSSGPLLAESDALVVASHNEPFSVAMLEALAAGVPLIAADSGGARDLVEPPVNGLRFRTGDAGDLARVLREVVETDALAKVRIDAEGLRRFTAPVAAARWAEVYARVAGNPK